MCLGQRLASEFVRVTALAEALKLAEDRLWLRSKVCIDFQCAEDFLPFDVTTEGFIGDDKRTLRRKARAYEAEAHECAARACDLSAPIRRQFARAVLEQLSQWVLKQSSGEGPPFSIYRMLDPLDEVLGVDYTPEHSIHIDAKATERLYKGAGVGVQTSYASIVNAIARVGVRAGDRWIDLGSGYGRLGLALGVMHDAVHFTGYEFVEHRVAGARGASKRLEFGDRIRFITQDLSDPSFQMPAADVYYMFDPFTADTYERVLRQLRRIGDSRSITVIAKGGAQQLLQLALESCQSQWTVTERFDEGTLSIFRSQSGACRQAYGAL